MSTSIKIDIRNTPVPSPEPEHRKKVSKEALLLDKICYYVEQGKDAPAPYLKKVWTKLCALSHPSPLSVKIIHLLKPWIEEFAPDQVEGTDIITNSSNYHDLED